MTDREKEANDMLQEIARDVKNKLPEGMGFCLLAYEFGDAEGRRMMYVSNSDRSDVKKAMMEFVQNIGEKEYGKDV